MLCLRAGLEESWRKLLFLIANIVTTSKALVTSSDALVSTSKEGCSTTTACPKFSEKASLVY